MAGPGQAYDNERPFSSKPKRPITNMFEIIGIAVVAFIAWLIIKGYLRAKSTIRSQEFGKEARYIATHEFNVPDRFFTYFVQVHMDDVKTQALQLKDRAGFERFSWPRLMAWAIYINYRSLCDMFLEGGPAKGLFKKLNLTEEDARDCVAVEFESRLPTA